MTRKGILGLLFLFVVFSILSTILMAVIVSVFYPSMPFWQVLVAGMMWATILTLALIVDDT